MNSCGTEVEISVEKADVQGSENESKKKIRLLDENDVIGLHWFYYFLIIVYAP